MIYCVEDEGNIRDLVVYTLNSTGFSACGFADGSALWDALEKELPELVLLDIMLPGEDGLSILRKLKSLPQTKEIPVIMVTAKGSEYDKVQGLDDGADDYVAKPFGMLELVSRVKAVLRRSKREDHENKALTFQNIKMNLQGHEVYVDGTKIVLTYKEYEVLRKLLQNQGTVITREQMLEEIWGYEYIGETRTVDVHVRTLRQKLGTGGEWIQTVRGVGYRIGGADEN